MNNKALKLMLVGLLLAVATTLPAQSSPAPTPNENAKLALTPPMGWNTWNKFACNVSETLIKQAADAMASNGMKDAGYQYVVIDDCWQKSRDAEGFIQPDPERFPNGIKPVADYVHSKGLKFGIYTDMGVLTCGGKPGSRGHEYQDALRYAQWGVDYVKADWCSTVPGQNAEASYTTMRAALNATGRPIVLSICEWGDNKPWLWGERVGGNLWRTTGDIRDQWAGAVKWPGGSCCSWGFTDIVDKQEGIENASGPGHWNDPDMLEVGNGGLTDVEARSHFSLWAMLAAPLIAGNDLTNMTPATREILTNKEVIAIDQDPLGKQGSRIWRQEGLEIYQRPLADGGMAIILFNRTRQAAPITVTTSVLGLDWNAEMKLRDLWLHKDLGGFVNHYTANVEPHGVVMLRLAKPEKK